MGDAPHGPLVFGVPDEGGAPNGPLFDVISSDGSIVVTDGGGPTVDVETRKSRYASIEIDNSDFTVPNGGVLPTVWTSVPFNLFGPAHVLEQHPVPTVGPARIVIPADEDGDYDIEYTLTLHCDDFDAVNPGIWHTLTIGGDPGAGGTILTPTLTIFDLPSDTRAGATDITYSICTSMLRTLLAGEFLSLWMTGLNPVGSDPLHFSRVFGSMEAVRLRKVFPV